MKISLISSLARKKTISDSDNENKLARVLTLFDLSALGIGATLGVGVYVLAGSVARKVAGPAVCISFIIGAIAAAASGLCYAEFASRVPKAGSAYIYSYVTIGEFVAFVIGWNMLLEYGIGTASTARGLGGYIDALTNGTMKNGIKSWAQMDVSFFADYPDFFSFSVVVLFTILLCVGVKESTRLNNIFTALNLTTIVVVVISGAIKANPSYWNIRKNDIPQKFQGHAGDGGFLPFGFSGLLAGAAQCFYGFVGFDCVTITGEEAKNPKRDIPLAIVISLITIFAVYFSLSTVLTMMWPYYDQDPIAPLIHIYDQFDWVVIKWIVTLGAVLALCATLLSGVLGLPRIIYAMSSDGLIFKFLSKVNPKSKTPIVATIASGIIIGTMTILFDIDQLINMMSIGTLLAYTIVAICVLLLRYTPTSEQVTSETYSFKLTIWILLIQLLNIKRNKQATNLSKKITYWSIFCFTISAFGFNGLLIFELNNFSQLQILLPFVFLTLLLLLSLLIIARQPSDTTDILFQVPCVPFIPCLSIFMNVHLMLQLDKNTWIRLIIWLLFGFIIYFFYGIKQSEERKLRESAKATSCDRS